MLQELLMIGFSDAVTLSMKASKLQLEAMAISSES
jgi:hypothetical protein